MLEVISQANKTEKILNKWYPMYSGIPSVSDYEACINSDIFKKIEKSSNDFISKNEVALKKYPWSKDSLHSWSRQWEYPFAYDSIQRYVEQNQNIDSIKILDAGSGVTFFPYMIAQLPHVEVNCGDYDSRWVRIYDEINKNEKHSVAFQCVDLRKQLPYSSNDLDIIYCISVLEHTGDFALILKEFKRVLKPGGLLIVTFDISLDGHHDINLEKSRKLLVEISREFQPPTPLNFEQNLSKLVANPESYVTTNYILDYNRELLPCPWNETPILTLKRIIKNRRIQKHDINLSFFCVTVQKRVNDGL
ncbi:MAG: class I SAM-dependent methyltransferase [SAR324 cluster bacterium]|nr:class I SAM-dependent methyltransferase [SAR324 cluster bacterium]